MAAGLTRKSAGRPIVMNVDSFGFMSPDRYIGAEYLKTIRHFFSSEVRWKAIRWFCLLIGLLLTLSGLNVVNSYVGRDFMTAISDRRPTTIRHICFPLRRRLCLFNGRRRLLSVFGRTPSPPLADVAHRIAHRPLHVE